MDLAALTEAVLLQRLERLRDSGPSLRGLGSARFQQNGTILNVGGVQARSGKGEEIVHRVVRFARERWFNITWTYVVDRDDPAIAATLKAYGFRTAETLRLMGRMGPLIEPVMPTPNVAVAPIISIEEMQAYERISSWGFNNDPSPSRDFLILRGRERWDEQQAQWYQYYLGRLNGNPAGGAYISLWERVPTIYGVVTAPPARGRGVAGRVMTRLVQDTLARGFPWTCLYVAQGNPAERLYRSLGYSFLLEFVTFQLNEARW